MSRERVGRDQYDNDLRIKMCINKNQEDLSTIHHELGHDYYYNDYYKLPILFQNGANDGFHEAIGDTVPLSMTPEYLKEKGLLDKVVKNDKATINQQMNVALEKIAFLPFGVMVDKWRWDVFSGKVKPDQYNKHWWELTLQYQGIVAAGARAATADFDPGAKYHVPANVPYMRYFLAAVLQFQFHRALCKKAGFTGPLHECSIYGNKEAGAAFRKMLQLGASKPWQDALFELTGEREMDATRDPRVLRAAAEVARGAEQGPAVRLVMSRAAAGRTGDLARDQLPDRFVEVVAIARRLSCRPRCSGTCAAQGVGQQIARPGALTMTTTRQESVASLLTLSFGHHPRRGHHGLAPPTRPAQPARVATPAGSGDETAAAATTRRTRWTRPASTACRARSTSRRTCRARSATSSTRFIDATDGPDDPDATGSSTRSSRRCRTAR